LQTVATVPNLLQLRWWILGLGDGVEIIQPESFCDQIAATIEKMQSRYRK